MVAYRFEKIRDTFLTPRMQCGTKYSNDANNRDVDSVLDRPRDLWEDRGGRGDDRRVTVNNRYDQMAGLPLCESLFLSKIGAG